MPTTRVVTFMREYKEILMVLAAGGAVAAVSPHIATGPDRLAAIEVQVQALVRLQCVTAPLDRLALAGVECGPFTQQGRAGR